jgi:hypothetical protein
MPEGSFAFFALYLVLSISLALNVYLGWRVMRLSQPQALRQGGVQEKSVFPVMPVHRLDGKKSLLLFDGEKPTVLYVLSSTCRWCKRNQLNITSLAAARNTEFRFVGLSISDNGLKAYLDSSPLPFPVFVTDVKDAAIQVGLNVTPQTVVIGRGGHVERVWVGAFSDNRQKQVEDFFKIKLPGLQAE